MGQLLRTIQDRLRPHPVLDALARLNGRVTLGLYLEMQKGRVFTGDLSRTFYQRHGISAKNLEHLHIALKGRIDSEVECAKLHVEQLVEKIAAKSRDVARREKRIDKFQAGIAKEERRANSDGARIARLHTSIQGDRRALHQHRRRLGTLEARLEAARSRVANPVLCFGSRSLLRERADLTDPQEIPAWRSEWDRRRMGEIFVPGDAKAEFGNQFVRLAQHPEGGWSLLLRLPEALKHLADRSFKVSGYAVHEVDVGRVRFPHGGEAFAAMIARQRAGEACPVTWRLQPHPRGGWSVSCTFRDALPELSVRDFAKGALGLDFNAGFVTLSHVDGQGNLVSTTNLPLVTHSRSTEQNLDTCRKTAAEVARIACYYGVPVVAEALDFKRKKVAVSSEQGARYARMLNGLAYATFAQCLDSAAARAGVALVRVNPVYTSIVGVAKFSRRLGISSHAGAAIAIARRAMGFSERVPGSVEVSLGRNVHGTLPRPEVRHDASASDRTGIASRRKGGDPISSRRHVWVLWSVVRARRSAALTAHCRTLRETRAPSAPRGRPPHRASGSGAADPRKTRVRPPEANPGHRVVGRVCGGAAPPHGFPCGHSTRKSE